MDKMQLNWNCTMTYDRKNYVYTGYSSGSIWLSMFIFETNLRRKNSEKLTTGTLCLKTAAGESLTSFCSIDPAKLTDANLNVKSQKGVIDKPKSKKPKLGKGSDVGPARKDKVSSKSTKKPHKDAKDVSDLDTDAGPSMGAKN
jgi:hypothetical protein